MITESDIYNMGARIKQIRQTKGYTQLQLADRMNVPNITIYKIEHNMIDIPLSHLPSIARALGVSIDFLLRGRE